MRKWKCDNWIPWNDLAEMMDTAIEKNLLFVSNYQSIKFTPRKLLKAWEDGKFRWGTTNWTLLTYSSFIDYNSRKMEKLVEENNKLIQQQLDEEKYWNGEVK